MRHSNHIFPSVEEQFQIYNSVLPFTIVNIFCHRFFLSPTYRLLPEMVRDVRKRRGLQIEKYSHSRDTTRKRTKIQEAPQISRYPINIFAIKQTEKIISQRSNRSRKLQWLQSNFSQKKFVECLLKHVRIVKSWRTYHSLFPGFLNSDITQ